MGLFVSAQIRGLTYRDNTARELTVFFSNTGKPCDVGPCHAVVGEFGIYNPKPGFFRRPLYADSLRFPAFHAASGSLSRFRLLILESAGNRFHNELS